MATTQNMITKTLGVTGNVGRYGENETGEYLLSLKGKAGMLVFDEMRRSDFQVKACIKSITLPIIRNTYHVRPASDDPTDVEIAKFIEDSLFKTMSMTWSDTIRHIMLYKVFGFMPMEKIYLPPSKEDRRVRLKKLDPRMPQSVTKWNFDHDSLISIEQMDSDARTYEVPIEKLLVFTNEKEGANWEGISDFRAVFPNWFIKKELIKIDAIRHERWGVGIPVGTAPNGESSASAAWKELELTLAAIYAQEQGYIIKHEGWAIEILNGNTGSGTVDIIESIRYHDEAIALGFIANFLKLGQTENGARALGETFMEFFLMNLQDSANYICDVLNRFLIRELVGFNYNVKEYPMLVPETIKEIDPEVVAILTKTGVLTKDMQIENAMRRRLNLPEREEEETEEKKKKSDVSKKKEKPDEEIPEDDENEGTDDTARPKKNEARLFRELTDEELRICDIVHYDFSLSSETLALQNILLNLKERQIEKIAEKLAEGKKIHQIVVPLKQEMFEAAYERAERMLIEGYRQIVGEMKKQAFETEKPHKSGLLAYITEKIQILIEGAAHKLLSSLSKQALSYKRQGYKDTELHNRILGFARDKIHDSAYRQLARHVVNTSWAEGRGEALREFADKIDHITRSNVLDNNTCDVCKDKSGREYPPLSTHDDTVLPDPDCDGLDECRCFLYPVMKGEK